MEQANDPLPQPPDKEKTPNKRGENDLPQERSRSRINIGVQGGLVEEKDNDDGNRQSE